VTGEKGAKTQRYIARDAAASVAEIAIVLRIMIRIKTGKAKTNAGEVRGTATAANVGRT
jgi:hypothetical protein